MSMNMPFMRTSLLVDRFWPLEGHQLLGKVINIMENVSILILQCLLQLFIYDFRNPKM